MNDYNLKLETCPICKGECSVGTVRYCESTVREQNWPQSTYYFINCVSCGTNNKGLVGYSTPGKAAEHWNTRPTAQIVEESSFADLAYDIVEALDSMDYHEGKLRKRECVVAILRKHSLPETKGEVAVEFPSDANRSLVEIFYLKDHEPFVCGVYGKVTGDQIAKIERDCAENPGVGFGKGDGQYLFSCHWEPGQYGDEGRCEIAPYWHLDLIAFKPIPLEKPKGGV